MGIGAAVGAGLLSDLLNYEVNFWTDYEQRGWRSASEYEDYRADYAKRIEQELMKQQMDYNSYMSNTAYQRAVADMQKAGLNPAAMAGINAQAASSPSVSGVSVPNARSSALGNNKYLDLADNYYTSAVNAAIAKDYNVARIMSSEIVDNAKHAHRLEELKEKHEMNKELQNEKLNARSNEIDKKLNARSNEIDKKLHYDQDEKKSRIDRNLSQGDYYYERAREVEERRWKKR